MKIIVTGGTGFLGSALVDALLAQGEEVLVPTRDVERARLALQKRSGTGEHSERVRFLSWDLDAPDKSHLDLNGVDAVVHLAGEHVVGRRYTDKLEQEIRKSRIESARILTEAMHRATHPPRVFVCASAIGYYGDRPSHEDLTESSPAGEDFLARLCVDWEAAAQRAPHSVRVVSARIGIVLSSRGGALASLLLPFQLGLGGTLGSGEQVFSWIHRRDAVRALLLCINDAELRGPVNLSAPHPVDNRELTKTLGRVLRRPTLIPTPAFALRLIFGRGAEPILGGQRVLPRRLIAQGFHFEFERLEDALRAELGRPRAS